MGNGETLKRSKDTLVQRNTAYLLTTGLGRSTWRLAAEDGNVHTYIHTLPFAEYTTGDFTWLLSPPTHSKALVCNATRLRLLAGFLNVQ